MVRTQHEPRLTTSPQHGRLPSACHARVRSVTDMDRVLEVVRHEMAAVGYAERDVFGVRLALEEAITNGLKHGNRNDPARAVEVTWQVDAESVLATVEDEGTGFDPLQVADPFSTEGLARLSGRGVLLMRYYLSWLHWNERGNRLILCKYRTAG